MTLRRSRVAYLPMLLLPVTAAIDKSGPLCLTCRTEVDSEEMVEGYPGQTRFCRVLVRHHGAEELREFDFDSVEWDHRDLKRAMSSARFFDPMGHGDGAMTVTVPHKVS